MAKSTADAEDAPAAAKGGKQKLVIVALALVVLLGGGAAGFFLLGGGGGEKSSKEPKPGLVLHLEPMTINLSGGHYLKLGMALQQTDAVKEELDTAKASDLAISVLSGKALDELADPSGRERVKTELTKQIAEAYEHEIYKIYFTEFVMQ